MVPNRSKHPLENSEIRKQLNYTDIRYKKTIFGPHKKKSVVLVDILQLEANKGN